MNTKTDFVSPVLREYPAKSIYGGDDLTVSTLVDTKQPNFVLGSQLKDAIILSSYGSKPYGGLFLVKTMKPSIYFLAIKNDKMSSVTITKDNVVQGWFTSEPILEEAVDKISNQIIDFGKGLGVKLHGIDIKEAYQNHPFKEIEISIKVPKDLSFDDLNDFWDDIGEESNKIIDANWDNENAVIIKKRLLLVVTQ